MLTQDGRRAFAFAAVMGGCVTMTIYAFAVLVLVRHSVSHVFWLGLAAHAQIIIGMTGLLALLVKRIVRAGRDGIEISDNALQDGDTVEMVKVEGAKDVQRTNE